MTHPRTGFLTAALVALLWAAPALAEVAPPPPETPPPPPPPEAVTPAPAPVVPPPAAEAFRAEQVNARTVEEINQLLRGRCFGPGYAARFTLVVEDDDEDDVVLRATGPLAAGRPELYELSFDAGKGKAEIEIGDEEEEEDVDLDEDDPQEVVLLFKDGKLTLRADGDEVFAVEPDKDDLPAECHVLSWEVREEFYVKDLEIQPVAPR